MQALTEDENALVHGWMRRGFWRGCNVFEGSFHLLDNGIENGSSLPGKCHEKEFFVNGGRKFLLHLRAKLFAGRLRCIDVVMEVIHFLQIHAMKVPAVEQVKQLVALCCILFESAKDVLKGFRQLLVIHMIVSPLQYGA